MLAGTYDRERLASLPTDDCRRREAANLIDELTSLAARSSMDLMHLAPDARSLSRV
jgi:hypothetical protein